jgi:hypothetical protein
LALLARAPGSITGMFMLRELTSKKSSLRAFFSEAVFCRREDRFGEKRLAMTSDFLRKK